MYLLNKNKKRKFVPVNKRYARQQKLKKIAFCLTLLVLAEGAFLFWREGRNWWDNTKLPPFLTWSIKTINISAPTETLRNEIEKQLVLKHIKVDIPFSNKEAKDLELALNKSIEQIKSIKVKRKIFTKELLILTEKHTPLAFITTPKDSFFISDEGIIFQDDEIKKEGGFLNISLNAKIKSENLSKELVQCIKAVKDTSLRKSDTLTLDFAEQIIKFETPFGPVKLKNFDEVKEQISVLTKILETAKQKDFTQPYFIDFTYFDKGKVYLKQSYKDL
ncbi:MAG: hypothetical protein K6E94_05815 [Elusimicrobiaceae bacterium]|nr:hypothetical protein [Elusimicrobiaceae bacterium]